MRSARLLFLLPLLLIFSCGPDRDSLAGHYQSRNSEVSVQLDLEEDGDGEWIVAGGETVPFRWSQEQGKLVLRTKSGGMLAGELDGDALHLDIPGTGKLTFLPTRQ